eukprot:TRINITY_DN10960_c1_g1_i3.p1 TRINITY_DN10960_c1_g1~~TRINITY_DN10960_c1_g1_i3.p1  ORF type:complete len:319 (-),score=93.39 TRINITY_DN10960_c1_g1_i3:432-1388(-)
MSRAMKRKRTENVVEDVIVTTAPGAENNNGESDEIEAKIRKLSSNTGAAPLSYMEEAREERDSIDYSIRITKEMAENGSAPRRVRVYADGIYDLFHQGHARQMMQAKNVFPKSEVYLMVGCCNDALTHSMKGKTVMSDTERYEAIRHCRYVDEVIVDAPWVLDEQFLEKHKIDFVAHDEAPYNIGSADDVYAFVKEKGMFIATQRTEGVSTSDIVARIVRDYDMYVRRNLARGYSRKDLNLSFVKGQRYKLQNKVDEIKTGVHERFHKWEEQSKELIGNFLHMFGGRTIEEIMNSSLVRAISPNPSPPASPGPSSDDH